MIQLAYTLLRNVLHTHMPTQKFVDRNIRKLTKLGKASLAVTLPIDLVAKLGWREKQKVKVIAKGKHLIIKDWKR